MEQILFKIHIADLFQSTFGQTWLNPTILSGDIGNLLFQSTMDMPGMPDHTEQKLHDQIVASMDILLHAKSKLLPQIVFEILKFKKLYNLIGQEHFQLELKN